MAKFNTDTLSLFHTFSKTQVNSDANKPQFSSLGNTVNKSGHTVQSNEIWTEAIPFFGLGVPADFSSTAQVNDLVKDADGVIWQRNATPYTDSNGTYWTQKTKSITSFTKGTDGKYTFTEVDGALVDGSYLLNAAGVPTVKYHAKKQLTPLVSGNNAFIDSEKDASRLKIDGKWVDQFIGVTDVYVNGSAAVSYAPVLFSNSSSTTPLKAGAGEDYLDYCATGIILWDKNDCTGNEVISCFEYVGTKLDATVAKLSAAVFGSNNGDSDQPVDLVTQVNRNTAAISLLNDAATEPGSVAHSIETAINGLGDVAVKSDITITDIKVQQGSGAAESLTITDKSVTIKIPEVPAADVTTEGVVTTDGFTKTADVTNLAKAAINAAISNSDGAIAGAIDGAISDATLTSGDNAIQSATGDTATKLVTAEQVKEYVTENAQITLTVAGSTPVTSTGFEFAGSTGTDVTVTPTMDANGKVTYSATLSKATVDATTGAITDGDLAVSASNAKTIADKAIKTALGDTNTEGSLGATIASKVAGVTVDGTSIVGADDKVAKLTTTGTTAITADSESTSTKLATEASVARTAKTLEGEIEAITTGDGSIGTRLSAVETSLAEGGATANAIKVAKDAADSKVSSVTGPTEGHVIVTTDGSTKAVTITVSDIASAETLSQVKTTADSAIQTVKVNNDAVTKNGTEVNITALTAVDSNTAGSNGITIGETTDKKVTLSVTPATYTPATETVAGSWGNDANVAKASDVKNAISDVLAAAKKYSDGLHTTSLDYVVLGDSESLPTASANTLGKIYLVAKANVPAEDGSALSGDYVEYMTRKIGDGDSATYTWEKIGTTSADLSNYITKEDIAAVTTTITAAQTSADKKLASITNDGDSRVIIGEATADGDEKSISIKLADTVAIKSDITSAIDAIDVGVKSVNVAVNSALVGTSVTTADGAVTIKTDGVVENAVIPANTVRVENGLCYNGDGTVIAPIATEKIKSISSIPASLTTWIGDMPIWTGGDLSAATNLTTFLADMSSVSTNTLIGGKLDADSVESILYTIGEVSSGTLTLGVSSDGKTAIAEFLGVYGEVASYSYKGWTISVTVKD